jgi:hypothetical protein
MMASGATSLSRMIENIITATIHKVIFRAVVTGVSGNKVFIKRTGQTVADEQSYPRIISYGIPTGTGSVPVVDDEVIVLRVGGGWIIVGKVLR